MSAFRVPGSATVTITDPQQVQAGETINRILILKLRQKEKKIKWSEEVIDNEHLGRKSSKSKIAFF
jgi:hypothetical protein